MRSSRLGYVPVHYAIPCASQGARHILGTQCMPDRISAGLNMWMKERNHRGTVGGRKEKMQPGGGSMRACSSKPTSKPMGQPWVSDYRDLCHPPPCGEPGGVLTPATLSFFPHNSWNQRQVCSGEVPRGGSTRASICAQEIFPSQTNWFVTGLFLVILKFTLYMFSRSVVSYSFWLHGL